MNIYKEIIYFKYSAIKYYGKNFITQYIAVAIPIKTKRNNVKNFGTPNSLTIILIGSVIVLLINDIILSKELSSLTTYPLAPARKDSIATATSSLRESIITSILALCLFISFRISIPFFAFIFTPSKK